MALAVGVIVLLFPRCDSKKDKQRALICTYCCPCKPCTQEELYRRFDRSRPLLFFYPRTHTTAAGINVYVAQLLSTLLGYNPYDSVLDLKINQQRSNQAEAQLRAMTPTSTNHPAQGENDGDGDGDGESMATESGEPSGENEWRCLGGSFGGWLEGTICCGWRSKR